MKYLQSSRVYDFVLLFFARYDNDFRQDFNLSEYNQKLNYLAQTSPEINKLVDKFYYEDGFVFHSLFRHIDITEIESEEQLMGKLSKLNKEQIRSLVLDSIFWQYKDELSDIEITSPSDLKSKELYSVLNKLSLGDSLKWSFLEAYNSNTSYMKNYIALLSKILPSFLNKYSKLYPNIEIEAQKIEKNINEEGWEYFEKIMPEGLKKSYSNEEKTNFIKSKYFLYTVVRPFSLASHDFTLGKGYNIIGNAVMTGLHQMYVNLENEQKTLEMFFKSLGDPTRFNIITEIAKGCGNNKMLAKILGIKASSVSYHLLNMRNVGIIKRDNTKKGVIYTLDKKNIEKNFNNLHRFLDRISIQN